MQKRFKFWCKGTSTNPNFNKAGWWTYPSFILDKYFYGLDIFGSPDFEACQWTGLVDKNGREIYEGDIVCRCLYGSLPHRNIVVEWETGGFPLFCDSEWAQQPQNVVVIGNKFENPELL